MVTACIGRVHTKEIKLWFNYVFLVYLLYTVTFNCIRILRQLFFCNSTYLYRKLVKKLPPYNHISLIHLNLFYGRGKIQINNQFTKIKFGDNKSFIAPMDGYVELCVFNRNPHHCAFYVTE